MTTNNFYYIYEFVKICLKSFSEIWSYYVCLYHILDLFCYDNFW